MSTIPPVISPRMSVQGCCAIGWVRLWTVRHRTARTSTARIHRTHPPHATHPLFVPAGGLFLLTAVSRTWTCSLSLRSPGSWVCVHMYGYVCVCMPERLIEQSRRESGAEREGDCMEIATIAECRDISAPSRPHLGFISASSRPHLGLGPPSRPHLGIRPPSRPHAYSPRLHAYSRRLLAAGTCPRRRDAVTARGIMLGAATALDSDHCHHAVWASRA